MRQGAQYVGDEWVYVTADGKWLHGIPEPSGCGIGTCHKLPSIAGTCPAKTG